MKRVLKSALLRSIINGKEAVDEKKTVSYFVDDDDDDEGGDDGDGDDDEGGNITGDKRKREVTAEENSAKRVCKDPNYIYFYFFDMAQGDCTLIKLPEDKWLLIDCGTVRNYDSPEVTYSLSTIKSLVTNKELEYVIITHADEDHYDLMNVLCDKHEIKIKNLYFGAEGTTTNPLSKFPYVKKRKSPNGFGTKVLSQKWVDFAYQVNINNSEKFLLRWDINNMTRVVNKKTENIPPTRISPDPFPCPYPIFETPEVKVSLLVGNTPIPASAPKSHKENNSSYDKNTRSIATLVEITNNNLKLLLRGDSTDYTDDALTTMYKDTPTLQNLYFSTIPHHGSNLHCNAKTWGAPRSLVSANNLILQFHHPNKEAIEKYAAIAIETETPTTIDTWQQDDKSAASMTIKNIPKNIDNTLGDVTLVFKKPQEILTSWVNDGIPFSVVYMVGDQRKPKKSDVYWQRDDMFSIENQYNEICYIVSKKGYYLTRKVYFSEIKCTQSNVCTFNAFPIR